MKFSHWSGPSGSVRCDRLALSSLQWWLFQRRLFAITMALTHYALSQNFTLHKRSLPAVGCVVQRCHPLSGSMLSFNVVDVFSVVDQCIRPTVAVLYPLRTSIRNRLRTQRPIRISTRIFATVTSLPSSVLSIALHWLYRIRHLSLAPMMLSPFVRHSQMASGCWNAPRVALNASTCWASENDTLENIR